MDAVPANDRSAGGAKGASKVQASVEHLTPATLR